MPLATGLRTMAPWWNPHVTALGFFLKQKTRNYGLYHIYANTAWWRANQHNLTELPPPLCRHHKSSASSKENYWHQVQMNIPFSSLLHIWVSIVLYKLHSFLNNLSLWLPFFILTIRNKKNISFLVSKLFSPEFCDIFQIITNVVLNYSCCMHLINTDWWLAWSEGPSALGMFPPFSTQQSYFQFHSLFLFS